MPNSQTLFVDCTEVIEIEYSIFTENKDHLSAVAKNLNTNNPCIVLENINLVANAKNSKY